MSAHTREGDTGWAQCRDLNVVTSKRKDCPKLRCTAMIGEREREIHSTMYMRPTEKRCSFLT